jgi:transcriptional regulator with XRE-family HTH domain
VEIYQKLPAVNSGIRYDINSAIHKKISALRKDCGLTQTELGEQLGVSQPVIASYEAGRRRVPSSALPAITSILGVSIEELLGMPLPKGKRGPAGKVQQVFEAVDQLPQHQQQHILGTVEMMLAGQRAKAS